MSHAAPLFTLVAGETSGDSLGAGLIRALRVHYPQARFEGVTGPLMRAEGCESLADIEALSLFGVSEVVGQIPRLLRLRRRLAAHVLSARPAAFIGIDAPAFNTGLELRLKSRGVPTVHYVCPTAWAWREGRTRHIRRAVDRLLAIFPFEEAFFARHGIPVTYVGHPLAGELPRHPNADTARRALGLEPGARWVGLLPGSRGAEVSRLGRPFLETARWLTRRSPGLRFVAPMANARVRALFEADLADYPDVDVTLIDGRSREVMRAVEVLLLASGTASLEALLAKTPMVVAYALSDSNYWIARSLNLIKTEHVSMPNLLAGRALVPEFLQQEASPDFMGPWLYRLLHAETARRRQIDAFDGIHARLALDADARAARAVVDLVEARP
ncbi:lipid-A-disaccharide synthase [Salinisphaera orenii]|uniref:Lipid-A-disaccharide synthase n=1 Tax=Salinisphaera orenii YIM 95161 TaxID=1051139 RepID=A0A423Q173_9GAMM|nr:lipid-A-disaccharide synthase [Salinisphaera halophila]ROO32257.1 lipid-A-disaccharide synthase [Salinisphaera halophila YIM 95161]